MFMKAFARVNKVQLKSVRFLAARQEQNGISYILS